jgi:hypothetical protein
MDNGPAAGGQPSGPADDEVPGRWQQRAGFSVFFDVQPTGPGGPGELRRQTRLYHDETGDETTFPGYEPTGWVRWMLDRLRSAQPPSEAAGATASVVSMEIIDVRPAGDPMPGAGEDSAGVELRLRVTGLAELHRMLGAKVVGILSGPEPR